MHKKDSILSRGFIHIGIYLFENCELKFHLKFYHCVFPFFNLVGRKEASRQDASSQATPPRDLDECEPATTSGKVSYSKDTQVM